MATTYEPIATTTLGSAQSSVSFSSISGSYTDLVFIVNGTRSDTSNTYLRVGNGSVDTGSNYSTTYLYGNGSSAASSRQSNSSNGVLLDAVGDNPSTIATYIINFQNYSNTTTNKTLLNRRSHSANEALACVGLWRSTSAINTITIYPSSGTFSSGSIFTLYGILSA
jgi:hypothetical protein